MIDLLDILRIEETDISVEIFLAQLLSFQQQGISGLQDSLPGTHFQTLALTGNGHQHHIVLFFRSAYPSCACLSSRCQMPSSRSATSVGLPSRSHYRRDEWHSPIGASRAGPRWHQSGGIDQTVATKYELIGGNGRDNLFVETYDFDQAASPHPSSHTRRHSAPPAGSW